MIKLLFLIIILLVPACNNPPSTPSWPTPVFAGSDPTVPGRRTEPEKKPLYGRTLFEDDDVTVIEIIDLEKDGDKPSFSILENDLD